MDVTQSPCRDEGTGYEIRPPTFKSELVEVGRGKPMGELLRRYWHPIGLVSDANGTPRKVRALGEDLILFRDGAGRAGWAPRFRLTKHYGISGRHHSGLMLAARITLPHFSVSSAMSLLKSAGEPGNGVSPRSASRAFIFASARPALTSLLSLPMISAGVPVGTPIPYQLLAS